MAYVDNITLGAGDMLQFKCGTQANLEPYIKGSSTAVDGAFYLTTDTSRLYVGNGGRAVPVNQGVITVATTNDLPSPGEAGQFYYVTEGNILAVYAGSGAGGTGWVQINTNTNTTIIDYTKEAIDTTVKLDEIEYVGVKVTDTIIDSTSQTYPDSINILNGDGIVVKTLDTDNIIISAETSELGTLSSDEKGQSLYDEWLAANAGATEDQKAEKLAEFTGQGYINLTGHDSGTVAIDVNVGAAENQVISDEDGNITIRLKDTQVTDATFSANSGNGFNLAIKKGSLGAINSSTDLDPVISYDGNEVHFVGGTATLDVYDKASIDAKFESVNAMHYIGTVGTSGTAGAGVTIKTQSGSVISQVATITGTNAPTSYKIGDTFLVSSNLTGGTEANKDFWSILAGSLLIAMSSAAGTKEDPKEDSNGNIPLDKLYFEVINESFEQDTTYTLEIDKTDQGKINLIGSTGTGSKENGGSISVEGDGALIGSDLNGTGSDLVVTLTHLGEAAEQTTSGPTTVSSEETFTVVDSVVEDGKGHVTKVNTKTIQLGNFQAAINSNTLTTAASTSGTTAVGTVTHKTSVKTGVKASTEVSDSFVITSDTFSIKNDDATVSGTEGLKINMVWGSF